MRKHPVALLSAALLAGLPACVNLNEDVVTGLTRGPTARRPSSSPS